jgi:LuxR family transcriptional regulator, maltose regulon positive regulatory protein
MAMAHATPRVAGASAAPITDQIGHVASALPSGTVTFVFTDIEGSSQLWEQHPQAMPAALARHDTILREAIQAHSGVIFKTVGDGIHAAFHRAADALVAALAAQRALYAEPWVSVDPLRVRVAIHTGAAELRDGDYFGGPLNRIARILALGHGGQILLSHATHDLVADDLPNQTTLRALGEYPLKNLTRPEAIFQLISPDLPTEFPPLHAARPSPTPAPAQPFHLLTTKLYAPPARLQLVPRPRLLARLDAGLSGKLTLLSAPAGFGKTTLLSAWRASTAGSAMPFAWVSLDAADSDPLRFWSYVIAALDMLQPESGAIALALLQSPQPPPIEVVLTPLLNALGSLPTDALLVLDDYHLIDAAPIHSALTFLLDHLPARLHLVITTRADPPLPLTRLRARQELTELRAADLRFTAEETAAFLTELMGLPLSADDVVALDARTEGWVAGLQLAALAMRDRSDLAGFIRAFSGSNRFVVDYLAEEVLNRLPAHLQTFVLQTAILDQFCGPLCDAVLGLRPDEGRKTNEESNLSLVLRPSSFVGDSYSQLILDQLDRGNLFLVPLDDERRWYRYHHLFAEVLRARLNSGATAGEMAALHQRASAWYEKEGLIGEAVHFAFQMDDIERATALIERHSITIILDHSDVFLVRTWVERLPHALIVARPRLAVVAGFIIALMRQFDAVERLLEEAAPAFSAPDLTSNSVGELAALRATLARFQGDAAATHAFAQQALTHLDHDNHAIRALSFLNMGIASLERGEIMAARKSFADALASSEVEGEWMALAALEETMTFQLRQGQLREMLQTSEESLKRSARRGGQRIPAAGMGYVGIAEVSYEWNDLAGAMQAATQAIELLQRGFERLLIVRAYIVLARVHQARGNRTEALAAIRHCEEWFRQNRIPTPK